MLWFHGHTCNYPWTPFRTSVVLASSLVHTVRQSCANTGCLLTPDLDTHQLTTTVERPDSFCEPQLIDHTVLFCSWNQFFVCVLPDHHCLYLYYELIGADPVSWNRHIPIHIHIHVGMPVLLAVCIGFNEQESSSYYTVYPIFPSGLEGCLM